VSRPSSQFNKFKHISLFPSCKTVTTVLCWNLGYRRPRHCAWISNLRKLRVTTPHPSWMPSQQVEVAEAIAGIKRALKREREGIVICAVSFFVALKVALLMVPSASSPVRSTCGCRFKPRKQAPTGCQICSRRIPDIRERTGSIQRGEDTF
jgi:hypothetical protein